MTHAAVRLPAGAWDLVAPEPGLGRPVHRQELPLQAPAATPGGRVVFPAGEARLRGRFDPLDLDALAPPAGFAAAVREEGGALVVELAQPRDLWRVRLPPRGGRGRRGAAAGPSVAIHRVDGEAIADAATLTVPFGGRNADVAGRFTAAAFALRREGGPLARGDLDAVLLRSHPTGPRLGVAAGSAAPDFFWRAAGEVGKDGAADAGAVVAGKEFAAALERALADAPGAALFLVVESDAPCRFALAELAAPYRWTFESLPSGAGREVLRLAGRGTDATLTLSLPAGAEPVVASLRVAESLGRDRPAGGDTAADGDAPDGEAEAPVGLLLADTGPWIGHPHAPAAAVSAGGVDLAVMPLAAGAELAFELQADAGDRPAGETLAGGTVALGTAGRAAWVRLRFRSPLVLPAAPHWLLLRATRGRALWLAAPEPAARARRLERGAPGRAWTTAGETAGGRPRFALVADGRGRAPSPALEVTIGGVTVRAGAEDDDGRDGVTRYDLAAALATALAAAPAPAGTPMPVELAFRAPVAGQVTVYPPRIELRPPPG